MSPGWSKPVRNTPVIRLLDSPRVFTEISSLLRRIGGGRRYSHLPAEVRRESAEFGSLDFTENSASVKWMGAQANLGIAFPGQSEGSHPRRRFAGLASIRPADSRLTRRC